MARGNRDGSGVVSGRAMEWAEELATDKRLTGATYRVLMRLAYHANSRNGRAFPGVELLELETGLSERTIRRSFAALERRPDPVTGEQAGYLDTTRFRNETVVWHFPQCPQTRPPRVPPLAGGVPTVSARVPTVSAGSRSKGATGGTLTREPVREPGPDALEPVDTWTEDGVDERGYLYVRRRPASLPLEDGRT